MTTARETRERLLEAALAVMAERGVRGATTRSIAERAGVAELTLFRHFGSKRELLRAALQHFTPPLRVPAPSDDVEADLRALLEAYLHALATEGQLILRLLPELIRHPELLAERPPAGLAQPVQAVVALFRHHQAAGRLWTNEPPEGLALAFVGPLLARFLAGQILYLEFPLDVRQYVAGFLQGRGSGPDVRAQAPETPSSPHPGRSDPLAG